MMSVPAVSSHEKRKAYHGGDILLLVLDKIQLYSYFKGLSAEVMHLKNGWKGWQVKPEKQCFKNRLPVHANCGKTDAPLQNEYDLNFQDDLISRFTDNHRLLQGRNRRDAEEFLHPAMPCIRKSRSGITAQSTHFLPGKIDPASRELAAARGVTLF